MTVHLAAGACAALLLSLVVASHGAAQDGAECRAECSRNLTSCRNACIDSRNYDGCQDDCRERYEDCLDRCDG